MREKRNPEYRKSRIWSIQLYLGDKNAFYSLSRQRTDNILYKSDSILSEERFRTTHVEIGYAHLKLRMENQASNAEKRENGIGDSGCIAL